GQVLRIRDDRGWNRKAQVERGVAPRSYIVSTEDGQELRRNRVHLRPTYEDFVPDADHPEACDTGRAYSSVPSAESEETYLQTPAQSNFVADTPVETGQLFTDQGIAAKRTRARQPPARL
ncbi:unnamed protein product, partial [Ixodes pacificus]